MNKKYIYLLTVTDEEYNQEVCHIEAFSEESLLEQLRKVDSSIKSYEEENPTLSKCCGAKITQDGAFCSDCNEHI